MSAHTPGPWTFSPGPHGSYDIDSLVSTGIKGDPCGESVGSAYRKRDAHLIAAAPDLLDALRALRAKLAALESPLIDICAIAAVHGFEWTAGDWVRELEAADEAIANAEGK